MFVSPDHFIVVVQFCGANYCGNIYFHVGAMLWCIFSSSTFWALSLITKLKIILQSSLSENSRNFCSTRKGDEAMMGNYVWSLVCEDNISHKRRKQSNVYLWSFGWLIFSNLCKIVVLGSLLCHYLATSKSNNIEICKCLKIFLWVLLLVKKWFSNTAC